MVVDWIIVVGELVVRFVEKKVHQTSYRWIEKSSLLPSTYFVVNLSLPENKY